MQWEGARGKYFISSNAGYTVSKSYRGKQALYTAWPPKPPRGQAHNCINIFNNLDDAKAACEAHHKTEKETKQ